MMMLHAALLAMLQMAAPAHAAAPHRPSVVSDDSLKVIARARASQTSFERRRRFALPPGQSGGGRCEVRLGRFCWWYDGSRPSFPPEAASIKTMRTKLLAELDSASDRFPGDDWLQGMRVYYRVEARALGQADTVARSCRASAWWCAALAGYVAHEAGDERKGDSAFVVAAAAMPPESACAWKNIAPLLRDKEREEYERTPCDARSRMEARFWALSRPRLSAPGNEFRNEFNERRVLTWLGARATTPHLMRWGEDAEELVLRYGWPVAWSRIQTSDYGMGTAEGGVIGHDPSPSFVFAPARWRKDSLVALQPADWVLDDPRGEARYAPRLVQTIVTAVAQIARFRRADSTLVVAVYAAFHDSLRAPSAIVGVSDTLDVAVVSPPVESGTGTLRVMVAGSPWLAGVEVADTVTRVLARMRQTFAPRTDSSDVSLSDILIYRAGESPASSVDSALIRAVAGDTVTRNRAVGLFWETYGLSSDGQTLDIAVSVERVDRSWIRSARQRMGLTPVDTPIRIRWSDARPANSIASNAISLDLDNLDSGRYRVTLSVTPAGGTLTSTTREIELIDP